MWLPPWLDLKTVTYTNLTKNGEPQRLTETQKNLDDSVSWRLSMEDEIILSMRF